MSRLILISMFWLFAKPVKEVQIKGRWADQADPKSMIIVTDVKFIEVYGRDTLTR